MKIMNVLYILYYQGTAKRRIERQLKLVFCAGHAISCIDIIKQFYNRI